MDWKLFLLKKRVDVITVLINHVDHASEYLYGMRADYRNRYHMEKFMRKGMTSVK